MTTTTHQNPQSLRMKRFLMSVTLYTVWVSLAITAQAFSIIHINQPIVIFMGVGIALTIAMFWLAIRYDWNLRLADPSMTFLQCVVGLSWLALFMYHVPAWRDLLLAVYLTVLMFGIFQLHRLEFAALTFIAFAGYAIMTGVDIYVAGNAVDTKELLIRGAVVACVLIWCAYFGLHVGGLRERLRTRNQHLEEVVDEVTRLAERDHLTQAYSRRFIIDMLSQLREGAQRYSEAFAIIIIDIDFFKRVNDVHGHMAGDQVLADFSSRVRSELRLLDEISPLVDTRRLGRYGGEEFIVMLPRTKIGGAMECAERIRQTTAQHPFANDLRITVSAGVAEFQVGESIDSLLRRADKALYEAKDNGRNEICIAEPYKASAKEKRPDVVRLADYKNEH